MDVEDLMALLERERIHPFSLNPPHPPMAVLHTVQQLVAVLTTAIFRS